MTVRRRPATPTGREQVAFATPDVALTDEELVTFKWAATATGPSEDAATEMRFRPSGGWTSSSAVPHESPALGMPSITCRIHYRPSCAMSGRVRPV